MARAPDFDLAVELAKPSFTPGRRDAAALVALIATGDEPNTTRAITALAKLPEVAAEAIAARWDALDDGARARLVAALGLVARAGDSSASPFGRRGENLGPLPSPPNPPAEGLKISPSSNAGVSAS